ETSRGRFHCGAKRTRKSELPSGAAPSSRRFKKQLLMSNGVWEIRGQLSASPVDAPVRLTAEERSAVAVGKSSHSLALAELYEDEVKCKASKSDRPHATAFKSPRTPPQRFYSSEHECSGLHIVRPSTGKIVNELFKEAREHGAVPLNEATRASGDDKSKLQHLVHRGHVNLDMEDHQDQEYVKPRLRFKAFSGEGQKLGRWEKQTELSRENTSCAPSVAQSLWSWGPELGHPIVTALGESDASRTLGTRRAASSPRHGLNFHRTSILTPEIVSTPSSPEEEEKSLLNAVVLIDDSVPTTKIQIRLADGSRLIQRFNSTHRILDVRDFIVQSRPEFATLDFILVTSFPNKELTDESLTLQEADILNTVLLQQLK
ncbi:hypothetical protein E2I00_016618, partial [Balaenoptera physalus]